MGQPVSCCASRKRFDGALPALPPDDSLGELCGDQFVVRRQGASGEVLTASGKRLAFVQGKPHKPNATQQSFKLFEGAQNRKAVSLVGQLCLEGGSGLGQGPRARLIVARPLPGDDVNNRSSSELDKLAPEQMHVLLELVCSSAAVVGGGVKWTGFDGWMVEGNDAAPWTLRHNTARVACVQAMSQTVSLVRTAPNAPHPMACCFAAFLIPAAVQQTLEGQEEALEQEEKEREEEEEEEEKEREKGGLGDHDGADGHVAVNAGDDNHNQHAQRGAQWQGEPRGQRAPPSRVDPSAVQARPAAPVHHQEQEQEQEHRNTRWV